MTKPEIQLINSQGQKRWEKATTSGYENIRRLVHENLLPALERFSVLVSRLRGLSRFQESNIALGLSTRELDNVIDINNCLQLLAHNILISASTELQQFSAFSIWLRQEIEIQSSDLASTSSQEINEKDANVDHASALEYIQGAMLHSRLKVHLDTQAQATQKPQWNLAAEGRSLFELYKKELKDINLNVPTEKNLPDLASLIQHLSEQFGLVFARIAETQRRNVRFGSMIPLGLCFPSSIDMRMTSEVSQLPVSISYMKLKV